MKFLGTILLFVTTISFAQSTSQKNYKLVCKNGEFQDRENQVYKNLSNIELDVPKEKANNTNTNEIVSTKSYSVFLTRYKNILGVQINKAKTLDIDGESTQVMEVISAASYDIIEKNRISVYFSAEKLTFQLGCTIEKK